MHVLQTKTIRGLALGALAGLLLAGTAVGPALAEVSEVRITRQPGLLYVPMIIAEQQELIQKHAQEMGLESLTPEFLTLSGGGAGNEALLSGNVDLVMTGTTNMILLNDRTRGEVKGFFGVGGSPMRLLTRNPDVRTLADFSSADRIAVPTVRTSMQALMLQIAAQEEFGNPNQLDDITIQLGHPDALASLSNASSEVNSHFSLAPFQNRALQIEGVHEVLNSYDLVGQNVSNAIIYGNESFATENPTVLAAIKAALDEANELIASDPLQAAEIYVEATGEQTPAAELAEMLSEPGSFYSTTPQGQMLVANHFHATGVVSTEPTDWKDYYIELVHDLDGN